MRLKMIRHLTDGKFGLLLSMLKFVSSLWIVRRMCCYYNQTETNIH